MDVSYAGINQIRFKGFLVYRIALNQQTLVPLQILFYFNSSFIIAERCFFAIPKWENLFLWRNYLASFYIGGVPCQELISHILKQWHHPGFQVQK